MECKYPEINVKLVGQDGNVFNLITICAKAARRANLPKEEIEAFTNECFNAASYDEVLQIMMKWFNVE